MDETRNSISSATSTFQQETDEIGKETAACHDDIRNQNVGELAARTLDLALTMALTLDLALTMALTHLHSHFYGNCRRSECCPSSTYGRSMGVSGGQDTMRVRLLGR